jgi:hypothetical protein
MGPHLNRSIRSGHVLVYARRSSFFSTAMRINTTFTGIVLGLAATQAWPSDFHCSVSEGVHKPVGSTSLQDAARRDSSIVGTSFIVERGTGTIRGNASFRNSRHTTEILRDEARVYELLTRTRHSDITSLRIESFDGQWTFKYYVPSVGWLLVGGCRVQE